MLGAAEDVAGHDEGNHITEFTKLLDCNQIEKSIWCHAGQLGCLA